MAVSTSNNWLSSLRYDGGSSRAVATSWMGLSRSAVAGPFGSRFRA